MNFDFPKKNDKDVKKKLDRVMIRPKVARQSFQDSEKWGEGEVNRQKSCGYQTQRSISNCEGTRTIEENNRQVSKNNVREAQKGQKRLHKDAEQ